MSNTPILLTETFLEGTTGFYAFLATDKFDQSVLMDTLTVTLYDVDSEQIVNGRLHQDILNVNGGTVTLFPGPPAATKVTLDLVPEDTVIFNDERLVEYRVLVFQWTWNGGQDHGAHAVQFGIENLMFVP